MEDLSQRIGYDSIKKSISTEHKHKQYRVAFPFQPYDVQKDLISTILDALDNRHNALLQSPTGTGKTLCLLTSLLTWLKYPNPKLSANQPNSRQSSKTKIKILYLSRTHHQLKQVVREIRKTCFVPRVMIASSRDHACVNQEVNELKGHNLEVECRKRIQKAKNEETQETMGCHYYNNINSQLFKQRFDKPVIRDLQDLKEHAKDHNYCPFFLNRESEIRNEADIILMPYNYLLDKNSFGIYSSDIPNSIVVFDEAHNIQNVACDGQSFRITLQMVRQALGELSKVDREYQVSKKRNTQNERLTEDMLEWLQDRFKTFAANFYSFKDTKLVERDDFQFGKVVGSEKITEWFRQLFLMSTQPASKLPEVLTNMVDIESLIMTQFLTVYTWNIDRLCGFTALCRSILHSSKQPKWSDNLLNHYKFITKLEDDTQSLELWCMDSSQAFKRIVELEPHCIMLTSGTLSPLHTWSAELGIPFQATISNKHVISPQQVLVSCIKKNNEQMMFDFNNRNNRGMMSDLGHMLLRLSETVPNGVLVMFSSYALLQNIKNTLYDLGLWNKINMNKYIYEEPKEQAKLTDTLKTYGKMAHTKKGAFMFAVFRGKISEGIDLSDELCRAVVVVGVPFPPVKDLKIVNKKEYLTTRCQQQRSEQFRSATTQTNQQRQLDGSYWYNLQTIRAVNQAIGRVIRHIRDYGAIYFFDQRYDSNRELKGMISKWALQQFQTASSFDQVIKITSSFFEKNEKEFGNKGSSNGQPLSMIELDCIEDNKDIIPQKPPRMLLVKELTHQANEAEDLRRNSLKKRVGELSTRAARQSGKGNHSITQYLNRAK